MDWLAEVLATVAGVLVAAACAYLAVSMLVMGILIGTSAPRPLHLERVLYRKHAKREIAQLSLSDSERNQMDEILAIIFIRSRAASMLLLLSIMPPVALWLFASVLLLLSAAPLSGSDASATRAVAAIFLFVVGLAGIAVIPIAVTYRTRRWAGDSVVLSAAHLLSHSTRTASGTGMERTRPLRLQLEGHERCLNHFFSQEVSGTDEATATYIRERWAGQLAEVRRLKQLTLAADPDLQTSLRRYVLALLPAFCLGVVGQLPPGDATLVQGLDTRIWPRLTSALLGVTLLGVLVALCVLTGSLTPLIPAVAAAALYFLAKLLPQSLVAVISSRFGG